MATLTPRGIHIATCNDPSCVERYSQMCEDLEDNNVACFEEGRGDYGLGAYLFHEKFKEKVDSTLYTVIHLCPEMIDKLTSVRYLLEDPHYRGKFVYINTPATPTDLLWVFKQATRLRLYDDCDYQNIVERLTDAVASSNSGVSSQTQSSTSESSPVVYSGQGVLAVHNEFQDYGDYDDVGVRIFSKKENEVHYLARILQQTNLSLPQYSGSKDLEDILRTELYTAENKGKTLLWLQTEVLPQVAKDQDFVSIALLLKTPITQVREKVRELLWIILFSKEFGDMQATQLKDIESTLFDQASKVNPEKDKSCEWSELICLYFVTLIHRVHNLVEQNRSLESAFKRRFIMLQGNDDKCTDITHFMEDFKSRPHVFIQTLKSGDLKDFRKKEGWHGQFLVVLKSLLEIFQGEMRLKSLEDLQTCLEPKTQGRIKPRKSTSRLHWLVGRLSTIGITSFFMTYDERTGEDLHGETIAGFKVLKDHPEFTMESTNIMRGLIFSSNDLVRKEAIAMLMATQSYSEYFYRLGLAEVSDELQPINIDLKERLTGSREEDSWMTIKVGRMSQRVMIHMHLPKAEDHAKQLKSTLTPTKCGHRNTIEILQNLNEHSRILPLFAFRVEHIPIFYVTEDCSLPNLHQALYSKAKGKTFLQPVDLLELLLQALDAVDYLHKNKIVHRDITASSFLFNQRHKHVKLFKFELARINLHQVIVDRGSELPLRWSAPESLSKGHFHFRSDYWMLGHFIYEVITHGTLPYSDLEWKTEEDITNLIKTGTKKLLQERCIPTKVFDTIMGCTKFDEQERLPVCEAMCKLEDTLDDYKRPGLERKRKLTEKDFPAIQRMSYDDDGPYRKIPTEFADKCVYTRHNSLQMRNPELHSEAQYLVYNIPTIQYVIKNGTKLEIIETQKRQFSPAEESSLLTQSLGGILDNVTFVDFEDEGALSYSIPISCKSLHSLIEDIYEYAHEEHLRACAKALMKLHDRKWVHGALSPKNILIDVKETVYFTELAYMRQSCEEDSGIVSDDSEPPKDEEVYRRSAPEVIHGGTYSPASDVYSFGLVIWEAFAAQDENKLKILPKHKLYEYLTTQPESELLPRPNGCPPEIYALMKMCWCPQRHERPSIAMVYTKLNEFITNSSYDEVSNVVYLPMESQNRAARIRQDASISGSENIYGDASQDSCIYDDPSFDNDVIDYSTVSSVQDDDPYIPPLVPTMPPPALTNRPMPRRTHPAVESAGRRSQYPTSVSSRDSSPDDHDDYATCNDGGFMESRERERFRLNARLPYVGNLSTGFQPSGLGQQVETESLFSEDINEDTFDIPPPLPPRPNRKF